MPKRQKAQAALEFLTTYAWAFLAVFLSIGALYSFGIFDFINYVPDSCLFPSQFSCYDFTMRENPPGSNPQIAVRLVNNVGEPIQVTQFSITNEATPPMTCTAGPPTNFQWGAAIIYDLNFTSCEGGAFLAGERMDAIITFNYYAINTPSMPRHTVTGKVHAKVGS